MDATTSSVDNRVKRECSICLGPARNPVLTSCGHMFCWPCLYLCFNGEQSTPCPMCRARMYMHFNIIPIYGVDETASTHTMLRPGCSLIPMRPSAPWWVTPAPRHGLLIMSELMRQTHRRLQNAVHERDELKNELETWKAGCLQLEEELTQTKVNLENIMAAYRHFEEESAQAMNELQTLMTQYGQLEEEIVQAMKRDREGYDETLRISQTRNDERIALHYKDEIERMHEQIDKLTDERNELQGRVRELQKANQ